MPNNDIAADKVLVLAPTGRDGSVLCDILDRRRDRLSGLSQTCRRSSPISIGQKQRSSPRRLWPTSMTPGFCSDGWRRSRRGRTSPLFCWCFRVTRPMSATIPARCAAERHLAGAAASSRHSVCGPSARRRGRASGNLKRRTFWQSVPVLQEERRIGEERLRELFENAADAILIADAGNMLIEVNPAACASRARKSEPARTQRRQADRSERRTET